jgi:hypothetical protein
MKRSDEQPNKIMGSGLTINKIMGSGLTIDNVPGPVFEGEDQQLWISGVGPASCQMWDVRPDPMFLPLFF